MAELVALATALVVLGSAVTTAVMTWRVRQQVRETQVRVKETQVQVHEVHFMVNSQRDVMMARLDQLAAALVESGTAVPPVPPSDEEKS